MQQPTVGFAPRGRFSARVREDACGLLRHRARAVQAGKLISCEHQGVSIWSLTLPLSATQSKVTINISVGTQGGSLSALPGSNFSFPEGPSGLGEPVLGGCSLGPWKTTRK